MAAKFPQIQENIENEKNEVILKCRSICKDFGVTKALVDVDFTLECGKVHGLVGENGSGKSTLAAIIAGIHQPTNGTMEYMDKLWLPRTSLEARIKGVGIIVQESGTVPILTVAQNIFIGAENSFRKGIIIDKRKMNKAADEVLRSIGDERIQGWMPVQRLNGNDQKIVEIGKAYYLKPNIFIVDETTNTLSADGREILFNLIHKTAEEGSAVLIISHDIEELEEHCDQITILKDGRYVTTLEKSEFDTNQIKSLMIGRELTGNYYRNDYDPCSNEIAMQVDNITTMTNITNMSFVLHKGEILGIGGLSDCGMHTVGKALAGEEKLAAGKVTVCKGNVDIDNAETAVKAKVAYLSKDREGELLAVNASIKDNISIGGLDANVFIGPFMSGFKETKYVKKQIQSLSVKCNSQHDPLTTLSGGNKQKVGFAKWLAKDAEIFVMDCPTRGIDIGVKQEVYRLIYELKRQGKSIVLISEEMTELIGMSDRLMVMKDGEIIKEFLRTENPTEHNVIEYMI